MKRWIVTFGMGSGHYHVVAEKVVFEEKYGRISFYDDNGLVGNLLIEETKYLIMVREE